jgi:hypothetical protein
MAGFIGTNRLYEIEKSGREFGVGVDYALDGPARNFIQENIPADAQIFNSSASGPPISDGFSPSDGPSSTATAADTRPSSMQRLG